MTFVILINRVAQTWRKTPTNQSFTKLSMIKRSGVFSLTSQFFFLFFFFFGHAACVRIWNSSSFSSSYSTTKPWPFPGQFLHITVLLRQPESLARIRSSMFLVSISSRSPSCPGSLRTTSFRFRSIDELIEWVLLRATIVLFAITRCFCVANASKDFDQHSYTLWQKYTVIWIFYAKFYGHNFFAAYGHIWISKSRTTLHVRSFFYTCSQGGNVLNHVILVTYNFRTPCMIYFISENQSNKRAARKAYGSTR